MNRFFGPAAACALVAILALPAASPTSAATGDTLRVVGERVNLRAGPSDDANVRSQIVQGEQLLARAMVNLGVWYQAAACSSVS